MTGSLETADRADKITKKVTKRYRDNLPTIMTYSIAFHFKPFKSTAQSNTEIMLMLCSRVLRSVFCYATYSEFLPKTLNYSPVINKQIFYSFVTFLLFIKKTSFIFLKFLKTRYALGGCSKGSKQFTFNLFDA